MTLFAVTAYILSVCLPCSMVELHACTVLSSLILHIHSLATNAGGSLLFFMAVTGKTCAT